ncbi:UvrD-helicase domain-containing protein [Streptomyces sp. T12]|uniref:UvrD-helicase domain-containing protein n=1 Tax=Streptomyces sp. T12 TaxID=477697 RepID=UPI0011AA8656|nr:UvrD-helicase domain-containing protein [Streptomyces sp. T12]
MATMTRADTADSLTTEQLIAAATPHRRVYIEAAPGSGKTTVAAQRFGVQRFNGNDQRAVVAVSFTRSATAELRDRVLRHWGRSVLDWPHRVVTLDTIVCELLTHLLHTGHVRWPADHRELTVVDHWRVLLPTRWSDWEPTVVLRTGQVVAQTVRRASKANRPNADDVRTALSEGYCTHQDARHVFETALDAPGVRDVVRTRFAQTARALIVDEIFDANALDLALVRLAADAGLEVTVVGDPWQALYAFRGARPEEVPALTQEARFVQRDLHTSFRWTSPRQALLAAELRAGLGQILPKGPAETADVLIALQWKSLWEAGAHVLPFAYKSTTGNIQEAACTLVLSEVTQRMFGEDATFHADALITLGITHDAAQRLRPLLQSIVDDLEGTTDTAKVWSALNAAVATETDRPLPKRPHATHIARLKNLSTRLRNSSRLVPGLTAHQAKGREWDVVGVRLTDAECAVLRQGLRADSEDHRKLYVALTRARTRTVLVPANEL